MNAEYAHPRPPVPCEPGGVQKPTTEPKLLDRLRDAIRLRHYSIRTEHTYAHWVVQYIRFHNLRHPAQMGGKEVGEFLIRTVQELLGHNDVKTTMIYTHVLQRGPCGIASPLTRVREFQARTPKRDTTPDTPVVPPPAQETMPPPKCPAADALLVPRSSPPKITPLWQALFARCAAVLSMAFAYFARRSVAS